MSTSRSLPPELVALVHHVELNENGWWKKAISQIVVGHLWRVGKPVTAEHVKSGILKAIGVDVAQDTLNKRIDSLLSAKVVHRLPSGELKLSEEASSEVERANAAALDEQQAVEKLFLSLLPTDLSNVQRAAIWTGFHNTLCQVIKRIGANTYQLLINGDLTREPAWVDDFLGTQDEAIRDSLKTVLAQFLADRNVGVRNYILRILSADFFVEAAQLGPDTIRTLEAAKKRRVLRLVLDTNFVFSLLGLHDNPADDSVASLLRLSEQAKNFVDIRLFILPSTLEEAVRVLVAFQHLLDEIRYKRSVSIAASKARLPSIAAKYFSANAEAGGGISPKEYFDPYINGLRHVLRSKGIEILEWPIGAYSTRQEVVDDIMSELEREQANPRQKQKGYESLEHDLVLWHAIADHRGASVDSPFDVEVWGVTVDWRLIRFDQRKRRVGAARYPVVLYPSNLVQLLQFWVPRSPELDASVLDALKLPLFFHKFDPVDEQATIQIIKTLSRYSNIDDLDEQTIGRILADKALKGKIKESDSDNRKVVEYVREVLLEENKRAGEERARALAARKDAEDAAKRHERAAERLASELQNSGSEIAKLGLRVQVLDSELAEVKAHQDETEGERAIAEKRASDAERESQALAKKLAAAEESGARAVVSLRVGGWLIVTLLAVGATWWSLGLTGLGHSNRLRATILFVVAWGGISLMVRSAVRQCELRHLDQSWLGCRVARLLWARIVWPAWVLAAATIGGGFLWEWVRSLAPA